MLRVQWGGGGMAMVGVKLRELRQRRGVGMRELALRSGISHSTISLIEREQISPSVDTLAAVLASLGTTLSTFFGDLANTAPPCPFYAASDLTEIGRADRVSHRLVGMEYPNRRMLMLHERYAPGAATEQVITHNAEEAGIVTRGAVEVTVGDDTRILRPGDAYYFDSRRPHRFRNAAEGEASEVISAITPPTY